MNVPRADEGMSHQLGRITSGAGEPLATRIGSSNAWLGAGSERRTSERKSAADDLVVRRLGREADGAAGEGVGHAGAADTDVSRNLRAAQPRSFAAAGA